jgi:hypothetical protein
MASLRTVTALVFAALIVFGCDGNVDNPQNNPPTGTGGASGSGSGGSGGAGGGGGTVGGTGGAGGQTMTPDGGDTTDGGGATSDGGSSQCIPAVTPPGDGHHNAGADCLQCHSQLGPNLRWTVAGTLFDAISGTTGVSGATIEIVDANGQTVIVPTAANGNFYTLQRVRFPLHVRASKCPADLRMQTMTYQASCNGCHVPGMRIHLP